MSNYKRVCLLCDNYSYGGICSKGCAPKVYKIRGGKCYAKACGDAFTPHPVYSKMPEEESEETHEQSTNR